MSLAAAVLAGGQSRRMGYDKGQLVLGGVSLLERTVAKLTALPVDAICIVSHLPDLHPPHALPVISDIFPDHLGPLAGIHAALLWAQERGHNWLITCPCDTPFFPSVALEALSSRAVQGRCAYLINQQIAYPVFGVWSVALVGKLEQDITAGMRKVRQWVEHRSIEPVQLKQDARLFHNINTPVDRLHAEQLLAAGLK